MKIFYSPAKGILKGRLIPTANKERLNNNDDKIVIKEIGSDYHAFIFQNGQYEMEKKVLDYYQLVEFLQENKLDTYIFPIDETRAKYLMEDVRNKNKLERPPVFYEDRPVIITKENDVILKSEATICRARVRAALLEAYFSTTAMDYIKMTDLLENEELLKLYAFPIKNVGNNFVVPTKGFGSNELFYGLSKIFAKKGEDIPLDTEDLHLIFSPKVLESDAKIKENLAKYIYVQELEHYDLHTFTIVENFLDKFSVNKKGGPLTANDVHEAFSEAYYNESIYDKLGVTKRMVLKRENGNEEQNKN